jgi:KaiC/GvpD/RAD55 family RecA-like ATPase
MENIANNPQQNSVVSSKTVIKDTNFIDKLKADTQSIEAKFNATEAGFFHCRTANDCIANAKTQPEPRKLFQSLIFENELTILVADTGVGKSIFAVQIANEISATEKVLYLDLELSDKQFQGRYSENYQNEFVFNSNFYRVVFKRKFEMPTGISYEDYFIESLTNLVQETGAKIVIIDNMTRLITGDTDQAKSAKPLMDNLNNLKFDLNLSMLLLEHTKKVDTSRPIQLNDLQGSKMKANFADAVFTIGRSFKDNNQRYVKQLKVRSCETEFDSENVIVYEVEKVDSFLQFRFVEFGNEQDHLKQESETDQVSLIEEIKRLKQQGKSIRQIGIELNTSKSKVERLSKK